MGHRLELFCPPAHEETLINIAKEFEIDAKVIGRTEPSELPEGKNHLQIISNNQNLNYE
jgi:hypothetical protein